MSPVEQYIRQHDPEKVRVLESIREIIRSAAPDAEEIISYKMPAYRQNGILVWFAAAKNHCGLYAKPMVLDRFREELKKFSTTKSAVHFPYDNPLPARLITKIVKESLRIHTIRRKSKLK